MKLYNYRTITDKANFDFYFKALEEGYLWFADIKSLNDESDSMIYYDRKKEKNSLKSIFQRIKLKFIGIS